MPQHLFMAEYNGRAVVVLVGWDHFLQAFVLDIAEHEAEREGFVYSSREDPALQPGKALTIDPFLDKLTELGIEISVRMTAEIRSDSMLYGAGGGTSSDLHDTHVFRFWQWCAYEARDIQLYERDPGLAA